MNCRTHIILTLAMLLGACTWGCETKMQPTSNHEPAAEKPDPDLPSDKVNGAEFHLETPGQWKIPPVGEQTEIPLSLNIKYTGEGEICFYLLDTCYLHLTDESGKKIRIVHGRKRLGRGQAYSTSLTNGKTFQASFFQPKLCYVNGQKELVLSAKDGFAGVYSASDLQPGKYHFAISYKYDPPLEFHNGVKIWKGEARTKPVPIEFK